MTGRHLHSDPPSGAELAAATNFDIDAALDVVTGAVPVRKARTLIQARGLGHYYMAKASLWSL